VSSGGVIEQVEAVAGRTVSRETFDLLETYVARLSAAAREQNLVSPSTLNSVWERHILDSAQLVRFEPRPGASWVDVGSGAGLPGIVVACLVEGPVTLVEPRRLRAEFLSATVEALGLANRVTVECSKIERIHGSFEVITARAVAALERLLVVAEHLSESGTIWVLPKGKNAQSELAQARRNWQCDARVEKSSTDPDSEILVLTRVGARRKR
jgi:16S rRNA (guanine527-N7)-methyltransferase